MSLKLNEAQMQWVMSKAETPLKRLLKIYFLQFGVDCIDDWCKANDVNRVMIPLSYTQHADHIKQTKRPDPTDPLLAYPPKPASITYQHRAAGWVIYLDIVPSSVEWDDEMVSNAIKPTMGQMIKGVEIILETLKHQNPSLLGTLSIKMDDKNLTLMLQDSLFPDMQFPSRIGFTIEKIYM